MISEERARLIQIHDRLMELYVQREQAQSGKDWTRVSELQAEIDRLNGWREELHRNTAMGTA